MNIKLSQSASSKSLVLNRLIMIMAFLAVFNASNAQEKKWPTLLWEISGNGLEKPSYLYGTMHVSSKLAFHLGDPFFEALEKADVVALELHHENWLSDELSQENMIESGGSFRNYDFDTYYGGNDELYPNYFEYGIEKKNLLLSGFRYFPRFANHIVSRNGRESVEFEEDSWLDYFIYKCGRKLKKEIFGLETFHESMYAFEMAMKYNAEHRDELENNDLDWDGRNSIFDELESAYRSGNLDKLDSLSSITSKGGWKKYILDYRNEVFVGRMDSILKTKTMFVGMGAAHLPGETGVIEMLRNLGYTLKPIKPGRRNPKLIEALEEKEYPSTFSKYKSSTGKFEIDVPAKVFFIPTSPEITVETCPDLPNACTLYMIRVKSYAGLRKESPADLISSLDSLLYENIPGTIESQKNIVVNGYPAIDVLNKNRLGHYQRYRIIAMDQELLVIRLDGHQKMAASRYGDRIFNSFKLYSTLTAGWNQFETPDKTLLMNLPGEPHYFPMEYLQHMDDRLGISAYDKETGAFLHVLKVNLTAPERLEPDIYEISEVEFSFRKSRELKIVSIDTIMYNSFPTMEGNYTTKDGSSVIARFILVGNSCYVLAAHNGEPSTAQTWFNSVQFSNPQYKESFRMQTDSSLLASFELPYKLPKDRANEYYYEDDEENPFESRYEESLYFPLEGGEYVSVEYKALGKYSFISDSSKFVEQWANYWSQGNDRIIYSQTSEILDSSVVLEMIMGDTGVQRRFLVRTIFLPASSYTIGASYDSILGPSEFITRFTKSFSPHDTLSRKSRFENRTNYFLEDIASKDSLTFRQAFDMLDNTFLDFDTSLTVLAHMEEISTWAEPSERREIQKFLMDFLPRFKDQNSVDYLTSKYRQWADSTENQAYVLKLLSLIHSKEGVSKVEELLLDSAPLGIDSYDVSYIFMNLRDSIELSNKLIPGLYNLLEIEEYESQVYRHLSVLLDSGLVSKKDYLQLFPTIFRKAKIDYRRANSSRNKDEEKNKYNYERETYSPRSYRNTNILSIYWNLLMPFRDQKEVKEYFKTVEKTRHKDLLQDLMVTYLNNEIDVPDQMVDSICTDMKSRIALYRELVGLEKDSLFPMKYREQDEILSYVLSKNLSGYGNNKVDSLVFLHCEPVEFRNDRGQVYFYKVRKNTGDKWQLCCVGLIPTDEMSLVLNPDFTSVSRDNFDEEKMTEDELRDAYETQLRIAKRQMINDSGRINAYYQYNVD